MLMGHSKRIAMRELSQFSAKGVDTMYIEKMYIVKIGNEGDCREK